MNRQDEDQTDAPGSDGAEQTESGTAPESGTARARRILIEPLSGLPRPRRISEAQHRKSLERLARELSYMEEIHLRGLAERCLQFAGRVSIEKGLVTPTCPDLAIVEAWALALQPRPSRASHYAASVLRSAMGRRCYDTGMGVELLRACRRLGPPPTSYSIIALRAEAEDGRRRRSALRHAIESGSHLTPSQEAELKAWHDDALVVEQLVAEGDERREARAAEGEAA